MATTVNFSMLDLNEIYKNALKYKTKQEQNRKYVKEYQKLKREEKDETFLQKQREYQKKYYINNKAKVDKNNLERYYRNKNVSSGEESE